MGGLFFAVLLLLSVNRPWPVGYAVQQSNLDAKNFCISKWSLFTQHITSICKHFTMIREISFSFVLTFKCIPPFPRSTPISLHAFQIALTSSSGNGFRDSCTKFYNTQYFTSPFLFGQYKIYILQNRFRLANKVHHYIKTFYQSGILWIFMHIHNFNKKAFQ